MRAGETEQQMAVRHVAEQDKRIAQQEALIERLRKVGAPSDDALGLLAIMQDLLKTMCTHVERLSNYGPAGTTPAAQNADSDHS